jgi:hypothetical protein
LVVVFMVINYADWLFIVRLVLIITAGLFQHLSILMITIITLIHFTLISTLTQNSTLIVALLVKITLLLMCRIYCILILTLMIIHHF